MKVSLQTKLRRALDRRDIPPHAQREVFNAVFFRLSAENVAIKEEAAFNALLSEVRAHRRSVRSNKLKVDPAIRHLYDEYVVLVEGAIADIEGAAVMLLKNPDDPTGPRVPATLARITEMAARRAKHAKDTHLPPTPLCNASWPSWVDPTARRNIIDAFDVAYTQLGRTRGRRFIPFTTTSLVSATNRQIIRHRKFIESQRAALAATPAPAAGTGNSNHDLYRALHLCALRMAELWLDGYERDIKKGFKNMRTDPVPVNFRHLLTNELRARVRASVADPTAPIDPTGLASFIPTT